jgi:hypothetical protein
MAHTDPHQHGGPALGHEPTDANLGSAWRLYFFMLAFLGLVFVAMWYALGAFGAAVTRQETPPPPLAQRKGDRLPPGPRLQTTPYLDLEQYRQAQQQVLDRYAWVDEQNGIAQIPIERAIELVAERGLPAPTPMPAPAPGPGTPKPAEGAAAAAAAPKQ